MLKHTFILIVFVLLGYRGIGQDNFSQEKEYDYYLQRIANTESLIALKKYKEARLVFESIKPHNGIEYTYLKLKLNQHANSLKVTEGIAASLAISPSGEWIAIGGDSVISLWNSKSLEKKGELMGHHARVTSLDFSNDGKWLVSGSRDKYVIVWDIASKSAMKQLHREDWQGIYDVSFNFDASMIGITTWTFTGGQVVGIVHLFNTTSWELTESLEPPSPHPVSAIDFSQNGHGLVYGTWGLAIHYYDFKQRNIKWALNMMDNYEYSSVTSIEISPDNNSIIVGTKDSKVRLVDQTTGKIFFEPDPYQWHGHEVNDVAFNPSGKYFASSSIDESINIGDATSGLLVSTLLGHRAPVNKIAFHPDRNELYSISSDGYLNSWNLSLRQVETFSGCPDPGYGRALFSSEVDPAGKRLALACGKKVMLWDLQNLKRTELEVETYYGLEFGGDNQLIVGEKDGKLSVWDLSTHKMLRRFEAHDDYIQNVELIGKDMVFTSSGRWLKLWDLKSGKLLKSFEAKGYIYSYVVSKKNELVLLCLSGGDNLALDLNTLQVKQQWSGTATGSIITLSGDESKLAIGQSDGAIVVQETRSNKQLSTFKDDEGPVVALAFDQSGNNLASSTSSNTHTVKFWDLQTNKRSLSLHEFPDVYNLMPVGSERRFMFSDKHGKVFLVRY